MPVVQLIQFKEDNLFYYHIARKRFQLVDIDFPTNVLWYERGYTNKDTLLKKSSSTLYTLLLVEHI